MFQKSWHTLSKPFAISLFSIGSVWFSQDRFLGLCGIFSEWSRLKIMKLSLGKWRRKFCDYKKSTFCAGKKHASGNFNLRSVEFSLFRTPDPFPLPFIAHQSGPSFFRCFLHMETSYVSNTKILKSIDTVAH